MLRGKPPFGHAAPVHAARHGQRVVDRDRMTLAGESTGGGDARRPAPMMATDLPLGAAGRSWRVASRLSEATRFSQQMAIGSSITPRRQAFSQGRAQTRPRQPGKTLDSRFSSKSSRTPRPR